MNRLTGSGMTRQYHNPDTIFALASGRGAAGVAVLRLSGSSALDITSKINKNKQLTPRHGELCTLVDPQTGTKLDQSILIFFPAPNSFTGEDVVEIHCHGGIAVIEAISMALQQQGARPAEPGEFTRRAFENDKLDLLQAEALNDLVNARSSGQLQQALRQMDGGLSDQVSQWRGLLLSVLALIEAEIDFSEEDDVPDSLLSAVNDRTSDLLSRLLQQLQTAKRGQRIRSGYMVALIGPVNAGKSTLLNALAGEERAIVSHLPGTTRDIVRVETEIAGFLVTFADTAGLRDSDDQIEQEGVKRAQTLAMNADLRLFLRPVNEKATRTGIPAHEKDVHLCTKTDLGGKTDTSEIAISAKTGAGMKELHDRLQDIIVADLSETELPALTRERHKRAIETAIAELSQVEGALKQGPELAAEHVRAASEAMGEMVGCIGTEEVLGAIFSQFCIGK